MCPTPPSASTRLSRFREPATNPLNAQPTSEVAILAGCFGASKAPFQHVEGVIGAVSGFGRRGRPGADRRSPPASTIRPA
jgi:hypothetical protein